MSDTATAIPADQPAGIIDPLTNTLGKLTDIYLEFTNQRAANQAFTQTANAANTAATTAAAAQRTADAQAAAQWIPGVSNTTVVLAGVAIVGGVVLLSMLRK